MNLIVTLHIANGRKIVIELLPESTPNTVNSSIHTTSRGYLDHHAIERIVPESWVDVGYATFGKKEYRYLTSNESEPNPDVGPLDSHPGSVCIGGHGEAGLIGCEFFSPLRDCPDHKGIYPMSGHVLEGVDEIYRLEKVEIVPVTDFPIEGVEISHPVRPETIERMELELYDAVYPGPMRVRKPEFPERWKNEAAEWQVLGSIVIYLHFQKSILQILEFYDILRKLSELTAVLAFV